MMAIQTTPICGLIWLIVKLLRTLLKYINLNEW